MGGKVLEYKTKTIYREGRNAGLREGRSAGLREGRSEGLREGRSVGLREGKQEGLHEGRFETLLQNLKKLMQKMGISAEKAMDLLDVSEAERTELAKRI